jgi:hypothetical protein
LTGVIKTGKTINGVNTYKRYKYREKPVSPVAYSKYLKREDGSPEQQRGLI